MVQKKLSNPTESYSLAHDVHVTCAGYLRTGHKWCPATTRRSDGALCWYCRGRSWHLLGPIPSALCQHVSSNVETWCACMIVIVCYGRKLSLCFISSCWGDGHKSMSGSWCSHHEDSRHGMVKHGRYLLWSSHHHLKSHHHLNQFPTKGPVRWCPQTIAKLGYNPIKYRYITNKNHSEIGLIITIWTLSFGGFPIKGRVTIQPHVSNRSCWIPLNSSIVEKG